MKTKLILALIALGLSASAFAECEKLTIVEVLVLTKEQVVERMCAAEKASNEPRYRLEKRIACSESQLHNLELYYERFGYEDRPVCKCDTAKHTNCPK